MGMKRMTAMFSVICLIIGMLPARSFSVRAEEDVEVKGVTFSSGAVQDGNNRYLIYLDVDGTTVVLTVGKLNAAANYEFKITALESWGKESTTSINGSLSAR